MVVGRSFGEFGFFCLFLGACVGFGKIGFVVLVVAFVVCWSFCILCRCLLFKNSFFVCFLWLLLF